MKTKVLSDQLDEVELWNRKDASELERPKGINKYQIVVASRDWTVETIVRQVEQGHIDLDRGDHLTVCPSPRLDGWK
jgi:hypothetical protein